MGGPAGSGSWKGGSTGGTSGGGISGGGRDGSGGVGGVMWALGGDVANEGCTGMETPCVDGVSLPAPQASYLRIIRPFFFGGGTPHWG